MAMARNLIAALAGMACALMLPLSATSAETLPDAGEGWVDVGRTGYATGRLVLASACPHACPWGELGEFVRDAMAAEDYEIILCRNCNRTEGPRLVARAAFPPPLIEGDTRHGTTERVRARVDFGITEASMMAWAYRGEHIYAEDGPADHLRLIARIEDPTYLLVAVHPRAGISSLADIRARKLPVTILTDMQPSEAPVLEYYGLDKASVEAWGGRILRPHEVTGETAFDVVISSLASPANNPESAFWTTLSVHHDLKFLDLPEELLERMVAEADMVRTTARWGVLRGVDRAIPTVGRSGEVVFGRADMPDDIAYAAARAIDRARGELKWFVRPYSIDPRTVGDGQGVPLHPGAERYYREMGYLD